MQKVKSFEEACIAGGYNPATVLPDVSGYPEKHRDAVTSFAMLVIIAEAINEGKEFDWNDDEEYKWYPWFDMEVTKQNPSGFRFGVTNYVYTYSHTTGGSRLCYVSSEAAKYAAIQFEDLYRAIMVIKK